MNVVFDTGVMVSAIYWRSEPRRCLAAFARRPFQLFVTEEYGSVAWEVRKRLERDPSPALAWIKRKARRIEPQPLARLLCRDPSDDKFVECALAAPAEFLVSRDRDLLTLGKPFGIEILTPRAFLRRLALK